MNLTLNKFTKASIFLMLCSTCIFSKTFDALFVVFSVICFILFLKNKRHYSHYFSNSSLKLTAISLAVFFAICCLSLLNSTELSKGISQLEKIIRFTFFPFISIVIAESRIKPESFYKYALTALLLSSIVALGAVMIHGPHRIGLDDNALTFGCTFGALFTVSLFFVFREFLKCKKSKVILIYSCSVLVLALPVIILNSSRSVWLGISSALLMSVFLIPKNKIKYVFALFFITLSCLLLAPQTRSRLNAIVSQSQLYFKKSEAVGSVDLRLDMWRGAIESFKKNPIIGTGFGDYRNDMLEHKENNIVMSELEVSYKHTAHSNIFHFLMLSGGLGLLLFLFATLTAPLMLALRNASNPHSLFILGATMYWFGFGLTDTWAAVAPRVDLYILIMAILYGLLLQNKTIKKT